MWNRSDGIGSARVAFFREIITVLESACTNAGAALPYVPIERNLYSERRGAAYIRPLFLSLALAPLSLALFLSPPFETEYNTR